MVAEEFRTEMNRFSSSMFIDAWDGDTPFLFSLCNLINFPVMFMLPIALFLSVHTLMLWS